MRADRKKYLWIVSSVCFAAFMSALDSYIVNVSLPTIAGSFHLDTGSVSLVVLSYVFFLTATMLIFGKIADSVGFRKMFLWGQVVFIAGSAFCGLSTSFSMLLTFRSIQGIGGAMLTVPAYALIPRHVPKEIRGWAFGLLATAAALGLTMGPPLGGLLTGYFSWHWIFLVNLPLGILGIAVSLKAIPPDAPPETRQGAKPSFDVLGALLSFFSVLALLFALQKGKELGWASFPILACGAASVVLFAAFLAWESRAADPLVDLTLFEIPALGLSLLGAVLAFMVLAGNNFLLPFFLESLKGLRPQGSGLVLMVYSIAYLMTSPVAGRASDKVAPNRLCAMGALAGALSCAAFALALPMGGLAPVVMFLGFMGAAFGFFISPNTNLIMSAAPAQKQGVASGILSVLSRLSIVLGVSVFETIFSGFAGPDGSRVLHSEASRASLSNGFRATYLAGAVLCLGAALFSAIALRQKQGAPL